MKVSARELEVLLTIAEGNSVEWIAHHLNLSESSVVAFLVNVRVKYGVPNNEAAIAVALGKKDIRVSHLNNPVRLEEDEIDLLSRIALGQGDEDLAAELFLAQISYRQESRCYSHQARCIQPG